MSDSGGWDQRDQVWKKHPTRGEMENDGETEGGGRNKEDYMMMHDEIAEETLGR
jgi:hypothetical protein